MSEALICIRGPIGAGKSTVLYALHELMPERSSVVEPDLIKRMLDSTTSSEWRRTIAHEAATMITGRLLAVPRTAIVETHTKYPEQLYALEDVARHNQARFVSVLLRAPLAVCLQRALERSVPDIAYDIDEAMIKNYHCNLDPVPGDLVFDTAELSTRCIADSIMEAAF